jgi:putative SOS response-associated peptidase YedK
MPALLTLDDAVRWVDRKTPLHTAIGLLRPYERTDLRYYEVSRFVNSPANDTPECIAPALRA